VEVEQERCSSDQLCLLLRVERNDFRSRLSSSGGAEQVEELRRGGTLSEGPATITAGRVLSPLHGLAEV